MSDQAKKGICVRNQLNIWENLLETRIQLQKCLVAANKMPQKDNYKEMLNISESEDLSKQISQTKDSLENVLDKLLTLQSLVIQKYPETRNLDKGTKSEGEEDQMDDVDVDDDDDDEEIPSDDGDEIEADRETENEDLEDDLPVPRTKKRKLNDYEKEISEFHNKYKKFRNQTIENWDSKTRVSLTKNAGQSHSVVDQIEYVLSDKEKMRKRTQLKRTEYKILGQVIENKSPLESNEDNGDIKLAEEEYNTEIFDDTDFYHQLLRELIEVKSTDITDPVQLGRQWIQLQSLRSKMKRKIDTKATKGRKIRYAVHSKLVNYMAPYEENLLTEEAKNELYSSLFGHIQKRH